MNIVNKLTLRHMKMNRKRTLVTIIGITIAVAMITAVSTIGNSMLDYLGKISMEDDGRFHFAYSELLLKNSDTIKNDDNTKEICFEKIIDSKVYEKENSTYTLMRLYAIDANFENMLSINTSIEGHYPKSADEILISKALLNDHFFSSNLEIGDIVNFNGREYTLCGLAEGLDFHSKKDFTEEYSATLAVYTYLDTNNLKPEDTVTAYVENNTLSDNSFDDAKSLAKLANCTVQSNEIVLAYYGISENNDFDAMMTALESILFVIIMIGAISLISNGFNISIAERSRYLGMLASVGATKKQKRQSVMFEGFVVGIISIPLGIVTGILGISITFKFIDKLFRNIFESKYDISLVPVVDTNVIIVAVLVSILTILLSTYIPATRASKISPIDAIRQTNDIKDLRSKTVKTSFLTKKIFGFEGDLALKNLKRNKKRYRVTIFSLFISIVLFMTVFSYVYYLKKSFGYTQENSNYSFYAHVYCTDDIYGDSCTKLLDDFAKKETLSDYAIYTNIVPSLARLKISDYNNIYNEKYFKNLYSETKENLGIISYDEFYNSFCDFSEINFCTADEKSLSKYFDSIGKSYADFISDDNNIILFDNRTIYFETYRNFNILNINEGDTFFVDINPKNFDENLCSNFSGKAELKVFADANDDYPIGMTDSIESTFETTIIVTPQFFKSLKKQLLDNLTNEEIKASVTSTICIKDKDTSDIEDAFVKLSGELPKTYYTTYYNIEAQVTAANNLSLVISIFAYGFITLMTLVCTANIFNTISTSMMLRRREFATLRSVGMTSHAFNKMIAYESVFYGLKALLYGIPTGIFVMYLIFNSVGDFFEQTFVIPPAAILIPAAAVFIVVGLSMLYSAAKIKKYNIIEALRNDNI